MKRTLLMACALVVLLGDFCVSQTVVTNPTSSQNIVQPVNTSFSANNYAGIRYVTPSYNWTQAPTSPSSLSAGVQATVTLTPCPLGVDTSNNTNAPYSIYVAGTGTAEAVTVTGGTCSSGGSTGTIIFTPANSHSSGYTVQSASGGIQEAINDAGTPNSRVIIPATGANSNETQIYATVFVDKNKIEVDGYGAIVKCNTRSRCFFLGDTASSNDYNDVRLKGLRFAAGVNVDGAQITTVAVSSNVLTVTTASTHNFNVGDVVWAEFYSNPGNLLYHGLLTVASVPNSTTYTANFTSSNVSSSSAFGWTALEDTAVEDNAEGSVIEDILPQSPNGSNYFDYFIVVDNDQNASLMHLHTDSGGTRCDANFCGAYILGRADGGNSSVIYVDKSELSFQCSGNGILDLSGNSLHVLDSVVQGYRQYGIRYEAGLQNEYITNTYFEVGSCTNPLYPGSLQAQAGVLHLGQNLYLHGGTQANTPAGNVPIFANTGSNERNYWIVPHSSNFGYGPVLLAGYAKTNGTGNITIYWPEVTGAGAVSNSGTITYDVLLTTGNFLAAGAAAPYSGNATSLATGLSGSCSNGICTYTDTQGSGSAYSYTGQHYHLGVWFWPAGVVNGTLNDDASTAFQGEVISDQQVSNPVSTYSENVPTFVAGQCTANNINPLFTTCLATNGSGNYEATILGQSDGIGGNGPPVTPAKGRLIFEERVDGDVFANPVHIITLNDSNIFKTLATSGYRPVADANDAFIGQDASNGAPSSVGISFGAPASLSNYIGNTGDGTSWLERLTSSLKSFKVPITTNSQVTSTVATGTAPLVIASTTPVANLTVSNHPKVQSCGTSSTCSATGVTGAQIVFGSITLSSGSATLTGISPAFTSSTTYGCVANDKTSQANGVKAVPASGSSVTFSGTGSDVISYQCVGN